MPARAFVERGTQSLPLTVAEFGPRGLPHPLARSLHSVSAEVLDASWLFPPFSRGQNRRAIRYKRKPGLQACWDVRHRTYHAIPATLRPALEGCER